MLQCMTFSGSPGQKLWWYWPYLMFGNLFDAGSNVTIIDPNNACQSS